VIVVADTTPLNYLIQLQLTLLLEELYGEVYLPPAVVKEMQHAKAPEVVRRWANDLPSWITVAEPSKTTDAELLRLDPGECEAITLAIELKAALLLADDQPARSAAESRGIRVAGTLGILRDAANAGRVDFEGCLTYLLARGFRTTSQVLADVRSGLT
jgi:predicted nucleic acid-binding protein